MALTEYTYTKSVNLRVLTDEIVADAGIIVALDHMNTNGTALSVWMADVLPGAEETALDAVVSAHTNPAEPTAYHAIAASGAPDDSIGSDGDCCIDAATLIIYQKASGTWDAGQNLNVVIKKYTYFADNFDNPNNSDWAVNALAVASADTNNNGIVVRRFDDTTEEGIGFTLEIPSGATNIVFDFKSRAETAPGSAKTVKTKLYVREMPDDAAVEAWSSGTALADLSMPANENFQYDSESIALATLGLVGGRAAQFELTRLGTGTLVGDWSLLGLTVSFT